MKKDTGTVRDTSTGNESIVSLTLASASRKVEKPSPVALTKSVNDSTLKALAELLSLIQEDCRRYSEVLAPYLSERLPVFMKFKIDGIIYFSAPPNHRLDTGNGHILLDGKPVTGWGDTGKDETLAEAK